MEFMASGSGQVASGTFTGDGTINVTLSLGFAPDVVMIASGLDYTVAGWAGIGDAAFIKGVCTYLKRHNTTTATTPTTNGNSTPGITGGDYGTQETASSYQAYATYADGNFTISNYSNGTGTKFINGHTYTWKAFKA